jgi:hypothetical protein
MSNPHRHASITHFTEIETLSPAESKRGSVTPNRQPENPRPSTTPMFWDDSLLWCTNEPFPGILAANYHQEDFRLRLSPQP